MKKYASLFLLFFIYIPVSLFAQVTQNFYEHYTGLISDELRLTADLIKLEKSFSGFYYYQFKEGGAWKSSKPIALDGQVDKNSHFVLNEFGENQSFFHGQLDNSKLIKGKWKNPFLKEAVDFTLKATYSQGTVVLRVVESDKQQYFKNDKDQPVARFHISVLFPSSNMDQAVYHQLIKKIYYLIGFRGELNNQKDIISSLQETYFKQFQSSLENIKLDSFPESFNWEKSIRMDVINNEAEMLCLQVETYAKAGARDGTSVRKYLVFNLVKNKVLSLDDIVTKENQQALNELLQVKLRKHYRIKAETTLTDAGFFQDNISPTRNFYIHPGGLGFYYNVYEIAPYSNGSTDLFIPWEELSSLVEPLIK